MRRGGAIDSRPNRNVWAQTRRSCWPAAVGLMHQQLRLAQGQVLIRSCGISRPGARMPLPEDAASLMKAAEVAMEAAKKSLPLQPPMRS